MPPGGVSKEKGDYTGGDLPWGGSISNPLLGTPAWSFYRRKTSLLGCLGAAGSNRKTMGRLDFTHENPLHILTCPGARVERADWKLFQWLPDFPWPLWHMPQPEMSEHPSATYSTSQQRTSPKAATTGERAGPWDKRWLAPLAAGLGKGSHSWWVLWQCIRGSLELGRQPVHRSLCTDKCWEPIQASPALWVHSRVGLGEFGGVIVCEAQRELGPKAASEQGKGNSF